MRVPACPARARGKFVESAFLGPPHATLFPLDGKKVERALPLAPYATLFPGAAAAPAAD